MYKNKRPLKQFRQLISDYTVDDDFKFDHDNHPDYKNYVPFLPGVRISKEELYLDYNKICAIEVYIMRKPLFDTSHH